MSDRVEQLKRELLELQREHIAILHELGEVKSNLKKAYAELEVRSDG